MIGGCSGFNNHSEHSTSQPTLGGGVTSEVSWDYIYAGLLTVSTAHLVCLCFGMTTSEISRCFTSVKRIINCISHAYGSEVLGWPVAIWAHKGRTWPAATWTDIQPTKLAFYTSKQDTNQLLQNFSEQTDSCPPTLHDAKWPGVCAGQ